MNLASGNLTVDPLIGGLTTAVKTVSFSVSFLLIGTLLSLGFLLVDENGKLSTSSKRHLPMAQAAAAIWLITSLVQIVLTVANILGSSLTSALDFTTLKSFVTQIELGKYMFFASALIALVLISLIFLRTVIPAIILLLISLLAVITPIFQSHSASGGSHALAIGSLVIHVAALSIWVGGIMALIAMKDQERRLALPRFSSIALWSAIAVAVSGGLNAWTRLNFAAAWSSTYAYLVIAKVALLSILIYLARANRAKLKLDDSSKWSLLTRAISYEALIMGVAVAIGSWLSTSQPPAGKVAPFNAALTIVGMKTPPAPSLWNLARLYDPDALILGILIALVALYISGVIKLKRQGDSWPVGRTISFAIAITTIDFATSGGLGIYAHFSFEYHMIAHMILGMIAPIGIVLSAPITLALRTLPQGRNEGERGIRGSLIAALHSKPAMLLTNPLTALALFDGSLFALYFTNLFGDLMQSHVGHLFMNIHFILVGYLFFHVIIGVDPNPKKIPHLLRIVILFAAMSIHAFFSVALMSTTQLIDRGYYLSLKTPWLGDLLTDQRSGGAVGWALGEVPILLALIATFILWMRDDAREAKRIDRNEARMAAMGEPDALAHYNSYLDKLHERDRKGENE